MLHSLSLHQWPSLDLPSLDKTYPLEQGEVLYAPNLKFELIPSEESILTISCNKNSKNISFDQKTKQIRGYAPETTPILKQTLSACMHRYAEYAYRLVVHLCPSYKDFLIPGRTSYRPIEIEGRKSPSYRKDDTLLHVDAFPATPTGGARILRVFSNINPFLDQPRVWRLGEPFQQVAERFLPHIRAPFPGVAVLSYWLGITRSQRSLYDHYMLKLHNAMKADHHYQKTVTQEVFGFPPGSTWVVFTDKVSHAALKGQYVLEQTFYLPLQALRYPSLSPYEIINQISKI